MRAQPHALLAQKVDTLLRAQGTAMRQLAPAPPTMATSLIICGCGILSERWAAGLVPYPACTWTALRSLNAAVPGATSIRRASANPFSRRHSPGVCMIRRSHHSASPHPAAVCPGCHRPPRDRGLHGKSTQPRPRSREASCRSARAQAQGTTPNNASAPCCVLRANLQHLFCRARAPATEHQRGRHARTPDCCQAQCRDPGARQRPGGEARCRRELGSQPIVAENEPTF